MMKSSFICACNWKCNIAPSQSKELYSKIYSEIGSSKVKHIIAPTYLSLVQLSEKIPDVSNIFLSSQDVSPYKSGAHTGSISMALLSTIPRLSYTLVGHSERRADMFAPERSDILVQKLIEAFNYNITPILCIGETKEDYDKGDFKAIVRKQLEDLEASSISFFSDLLKENSVAGKDSFSTKERNLRLRAIVAYEPVWAIGTGLVPKTQEIKDCISFVREEVQRVNERVLDQIKTLEKGCQGSESLETDGQKGLLEVEGILYGGSVNDKNCEEILKETGVDGFLIGGAGLVPDKMKKIISICDKEC